MVGIPIEGCEKQLMFNTHTHTYIYIYIYIYIYMYIYIYIYMKTMCPPSYHHNDSVATQRQLTMDLCVPCLGFWALFSSLVTAMCNHPSCAQVHELKQSHCRTNWEATLFSWLHIYYAHLASVRFKHFLCRGSLMTTYIMLLTLLV